jgi:cyclic pyranopterin phosphate synthase
MPEDEYAWLPRETLLTFEEMNSLAGLFTELGVNKVRLTGGEPLLRKDLGTLIRLLLQNSRIQDLALTTNGILLAEQAQILYQAGLHRITVSLDTLQPERFRALTKRDMHRQVLEGIEAVGRSGFKSLKLDTVAIRGFNEDELADLIEYGKRVRAEVRFIEYMDVGGATEWSMDKVLSRAAILETLGQRYGVIEPVIEESSAPAQRFLLPDGTTFGIIPSTTTPFCASCDRSRLTADGMWYLCLYAKDGIDLRHALRNGTSPQEIKGLIRSVWQGRKDRGAEERKALERIGVREERLIEIDRLRRDPHLEMHARGG